MAAAGIPFHQAGLAMLALAALGVLTVVNYSPPRMQGQTMVIVQTPAAPPQKRSSPMPGGQSVTSKHQNTVDGGVEILTHKDDSSSAQVTSTASLPASCTASNLPAAITDTTRPLSERFAAHSQIGWQNLTGAEATRILRPDEAAMIGTMPTEGSGLCKDPRHPVAKGQLGSQCGCHARTHLVAPVELPHHVERDLRPAAKLVDALKGRTLCMAGDSFDYQIWDSISHGLHRVADAPGCDRPFGSIVSDVITPKCGVDHLKKAGWIVFQSMKQVEVFAPDNTTLLARFRYLKAYHDDNGFYDVIEKYCDVVSLNYGLHWLSGPKWKGRNPQSQLPMAVEGALAFLANLSHSGKTAIWRGVGAQHFLPNGMWATRDQGPNVTCGPYTPKCARDEQPYNNVAREVFDRVMRDDPPLSYTPKVLNWPDLFATGENPCASTKPRPSVYDVTVNQSRGYAQGRVEYWRQRNDTEPATREANRVTRGRVYWWHTFDLFNPFWAFHSGDHDCTHFCYVLGPFDAVVERLTMLLTSADNDRAVPQKSEALVKWEC
eukprot:m.217977 g.217977  ORF g.217977 m.217977 type:complete len:547 (+) comp15566_c0_seq1:254-1894(+)